MIIATYRDACKARADMVWYPTGPLSPAARKGGHRVWNKV